MAQAEPDAWEALNDEEQAGYEAGWKDSQPSVDTGTLR
jgi:hypothetical protein